MSLILDPPEFNRRPDAWRTIDGRVQETAEDDRAWKYIFCSDELPEFCRLLLEETGDTDTLRNTVLFIDINPGIGSGQATEMDTSPAGRTRLCKLLNPLRNLHSLGAVQIDGPVSGSYKGLIITSISRDRPTALDIIRETVTSLNEADEKASKGRLRQAIFGYKAALSVIRSYSWRRQEWEVVTDSGPFPGMQIIQVTKNLMARLQARIAVVYSNINRHRMVRIYIDRTLHTYRLDHQRDEKIYNLYIEPWQRVVFAELLHVAAMNSYMHGDVYGAKESLWKAGVFVPFDQEQASRYETWRAHADRLAATRAKRLEVWDLQCQRYAEKLEGMGIRKFLTILNISILTHPFAELIYKIYDTKKKGDRLLRNGCSLQAAAVYKTALDKIKRPKWLYDSKVMIKYASFGDHSAVDAMNVLTFQIQAGLAAAALRSHDYKEVIQLTASALKCDSESSDCTHKRWDNCSHTYKRGQKNWEKDQKLDLIRVHFSRALSLHRLGDTVSAIEHMEKALSLDPRDGTVFAQLKLLKKQRLVQVEVRKRRLDKLNGLQMKLLIKQARRRTHIY